MEPGERIKEFRVKKGLTQKELAQSMSYSDAYLSEIERGISKPSRDFLIKLSEIHGVSSDYILYGTMPDKDINFIIGEQKPEYGDGGPVRERRRHENVPKRKLIDNVIKILDSGNKTVTDALEANIKAFLLATKIEEMEIKGGD